VEKMNVEITLEEIAKLLIDKEVIIFDSNGDELNLYFDIQRIKG
jgi:hypothetical protein